MHRLPTAAQLNKPPHTYGEMEREYDKNLFRWAVSERKQLVHRIVRESSSGERKVLQVPQLERVASELLPPRVQIKWTRRELENLAELLSAEEASRPTDALIRAMRD